MKKSSKSSAADSCHFEQAAKRSDSPSRHTGAGNDHRDLVRDDEPGQVVAEAQRTTPRPGSRTSLPEDWHRMSLRALWDHLNRRHRTPQATVEAVVHAVRERGIAALKEPANIERLLHCDAVARTEINKRIARLIAAKEIAA